MTPTIRMLWNRWNVCISHTTVYFRGKKSVKINSMCLGWAEIYPKMPPGQKRFLYMCIAKLNKWQTRPQQRVLSCCYCSYDHWLPIQCKTYHKYDAFKPGRTQLSHFYFPDNATLLIGLQWLTGLKVYQSRKIDDYHTCTFASLQYSIPPYWCHVCQIMIKHLFNQRNICFDYVKDRCNWQ